MVQLSTIADGFYARVCALSSLDMRRLVYTPSLMSSVMPRISAGLIGLMTLLTVPFSLSAMSPVAAVFSDVPVTAWYAGYVSDAVHMGIVSGYTDAYSRPTGMFGPENPVTVGESLKIVLLGAGYDTSAGIGYGHWAAKYMSVALGLGFQLTKNQNLNLDRPASRAEVASLIADAFRIAPVTLQGSFEDVTSATPYAGSVEALKAADIVSGDTDVSGSPTGTFRPLASIKRSEMVKMIMGARSSFGTPGTSSSRSSSSSSSNSTGTCKVPDCGVAPQMPNWQCPGGTLAGPSCERLPDGRCGWIIKQCPVSSSSSSTRTPQTYIIHFTGSGGFQPSFLYLRSGDTVKFRNDSTALMWVASNPHPTHTDLSTFDAHGSIGKNGEYSFTFTRTGAFGYHNHNNPNQQGVVVVDP